MSSKRSTSVTSLASQLHTRRETQDAIQALSPANDAPSLRKNGSTTAHRSCPRRNCSSGSPPEEEEQFAPCRHPPHPPGRHPSLRGVRMGTTLRALACTTQGTPSALESACQPDPCRCLDAFPEPRALL